MSKKKKSYSAKVGRRSFNWLLIPLLLAIAVVPLIVHGKVFYTHLENYGFFSNDEIDADFFLYYKQFWFTLISIFLGCVILVKAIVERKELKFAKVFIPLGVYGLFAILSSVFSDYRTFCFSGSYEQFESLWVLVGYCLIAYYVFLVVNEESDVRTLFKYFTIGIVVMVLLGFSQLFGIDFFRTSLGKFLMSSPPKLLAQDIDFNFESGRVYMSLYNPNYVGSYVAMLAPIFITFVFSMKGLLYKIASGCIAASLIVLLFGSESRAGIVGLGCGLILLLILFNKTLFKKPIHVIAITAAVILCAVGFNAAKDNLLVNKIKSAFTPSVNEAPSISKITTGKDDVCIYYKDEEFHCTFTFDFETLGSYFVATDKAGNTLPSEFIDDYTRAITDDRFSEFQITPVYLPDGESVGFGIIVEGHAWYFVRAVNQTPVACKGLKDGYYYITPYGKLIKMKSSESWEWLERRSSFASGRGFIWAKTIPLLKDNLILGTGADTYIFAFPQEDFVSLYNGGYEGVLITKPHNQYLQMAINTGVVSLVAFLVFYAWYFFTSCALYIRRRNYTYLSFTGVGILCGTFGYMVVQTINDSSVSVAPIYWTLTGLGIAINQLVKNEDTLALSLDVSAGTTPALSKDSSKQKQ